MICNKCGAVLPDNAEFCGECGAKVEKQKKKSPALINAKAEAKRYKIISIILAALYNAYYVYKKNTADPGMNQ